MEHLEGEKEKFPDRQSLMKAFEEITISTLNLAMIQSRRWSEKGDWKQGYAQGEMETARGIALEYLELVTEMNIHSSDSFHKVLAEFKNFKKGV